MIKRLSILTVFTLFIFSVYADDYKLVWADEFNIDGAPNPENWTYEHGFVRNHEAQWYQPQNAICTNGMLIIEARKERVPNPYYDSSSRRWKNNRKFAEYTSSCLITKGLHSWKYGRFEMRARIDARPGIWPAFWTLGVKEQWPWNGEIDIMEYYQGEILANVIYGSKNGRKHISDSETIPLSKLGKEWADQFHVWRMDWDEKSIRLYLDDQLINESSISDKNNPQNRSVKNPFQQPHYILLNLAIGGTNGGSPKHTTFPSRFEIDYVRVYQK
ncbi:MAG TPA: glycoside hydrolase family 16 protein [Pontiella sp.]